VPSSFALFDARDVEMNTFPGADQEYGETTP
jgi:hypothetical protein